MDTVEIFQQKLKKYNEDLKSLIIKKERYSTVRLITFLLGIITTSLTFYEVGTAQGFSIALVWIILFIFLVVMHEKVIDKEKIASNMVKINQQYIERINGEWVKFENNGHQYLDPDHIYAKDLDIFGHTSLFSWINTTNTFLGRQILKKLLECPNKNKKDILKRQNAVSELAKKIDFCQKIECEGMGVDGISHDPSSLLEYSENNSKLFSKSWIEYIFYVLPFLTILSMVICFIGKTLSLWIPFVLIIIQALINLVRLWKVMVVLRSLSSYKGRIKSYQKILKIIEDEKFEDPYLLELQSHLSYNNKWASTQIKDLEKIVEAYDAMNNDILAIISNLFLFWHFHCVFALENWRASSGKSIRQWLETIGMFEALGSIAVISQTNPHWIMPSFNDKKVFIDAHNMGHPLINHKQRVNNSINIDQSICIITGSNMSGKTTFLRTIGINLVIAYAGGAVCAKKFDTSIMDIYTCMRVSDDLSKGISTFYAELLRVKMIIEASKEKKPMIFLIDEMFSGTNSMDRIAGAKNVLLNLSREWIAGLISTHDFELCALEKDSKGKIKNFHFSERYKNNMIEFDYKLKNGQCTTTNAKYLMKMVGIEIRD